MGIYAIVSLSSTTYPPIYSPLVAFITLCTRLKFGHGHYGFG
jgi:hypothetical protein